mgnify:CR=1 FL=1
MDKKKVLLVEDEEDLVVVLTLRLRAFGYDVCTAYDGQEGLEKVGKEKPDLIVLDLMLPKLDGFKVCEILKKDPRYSKIPIIVYTAKAQEKDMRMAKEAGADAYITKTFEPQALVDKIREFLT